MKSILKILFLVALNFCSYYVTGQNTYTIVNGSNQCASVSFDCSAVNIPNNNNYQDGYLKSTLSLSGSTATWTTVRCNTAPLPTFTGISLRETPCASYVTSFSAVHSQNTSSITSVFDLNNITSWQTGTTKEFYILTTALGNHYVGNVITVKKTSGQFEGFNYQGVARDNSGSVIANSPISLRLSILDGSVNGVSEYIETHSLSTNQFGLFAIIAGRGSVVSGSFNNVNWGSGSKFLKVELDITGGNNYSFVGTNELMTVPFALYALNSGNGQGATNYSGGTGIDVNNNTITNTAPDQVVSVAGQGATIVTGTYPNFTVSSVDNVDDADADASNELQTLSLNGNSLSISNGNTILLPTGISYTAGSGISISSGTINNTGDLSNTNELQTLSLSGNNLAISNGNSIALPTGTTYTQGSGIGINGNLITNTAPDQPVTLIGQGATTVTGTYPNFVVNSVDNVNDADASPTNELQTISKNGNIVTLSNNGGSFTLSSGSTIVVIEQTTLSSVTVANNDIIKIDGTLNLSSNYNKLDYNSLNINGGTFSGSGAEIIEVGQEVTFTGTTFQNVKIEGYETVFYNCNFFNAISINGSRNKFINCSFINSTVSSSFTNANLELNQCEIENTTINSRLKRCLNSNINNATLTDVSYFIFSGNDVDNTEITISARGKITENTLENVKINCNSLSGLLVISNNTIDDPKAGTSDIIIIDMSGVAYRFIKITNNIFSCNNASGGGSTNSSIKITGNFTGSYGILEMSNNHFDRGNKAIDNTASGSYKFIIKDNLHKNQSSGLGVTNNGSSLIVLDNIQL